ncbi:MAG TPA: CBS domain-containing protein [Saprospiraceae bacterium]|nr:CBS domain-containing protein [Saprospiraceae bacterium]
MMNEPISTIMKEDLITVKPEDSLDTVRNIFLSRNIHHLPVVDNDYHLVGIVTTFDVYRLNLKFEDYDKLSVGEVMVRKVAKLSPEEKIGVAAELFLLNRFHATPIVNPNNKLVGLVTDFDILRYNFKKAYPTQDID